MGTSRMKLFFKQFMWHSVLFEPRQGDIHSGRERRSESKNNEGKTCGFSKQDSEINYTSLPIRLLQDKAM